uniref:Steroidogenic acute regulatory protein n=1 Tax=Equus caballus TaxID=9796 RepID=A0A9L0R3M9_HORSE
AQDITLRDTSDSGVSVFVLHPAFFYRDLYLLLFQGQFISTFVGHLLANLVLHQTVERIHVGKKYGDIPRGIFVVRGENVVLLGEIDLEKESDTPLQQVSIEEILEEQRVEQQTRLEAEKLKVQALKDRGLSLPRADTLDEY